MLGLPMIAMPCVRTCIASRVAVAPHMTQGKIVARFLSTVRQPVAAQTIRVPSAKTLFDSSLAARTGVRMGDSPLVSNIRAYRGAPGARVAVTQGPTTSQQLWRLAGVGALVGMGLVALDGLRDSSGPGVYPSYVSERITKTYGYVVGSLGLTAGFATYIARSSLAYRLASLNPFVLLAVTIGGTIGSSMVVYNSDNKALQHAALLTFTGLMGLSMFPLAEVGGAILQRAAIGTAAVVGSISLAAATTRSDNHLAMAGPLSIGLGVVFAASIGQLFLPASPLLYNAVIYGGLAVFGGLTYVDTQRMIQKAKFQTHYDPLKSSMRIYMDVLNIFWRLVAILQNNQRKK